MRKLFLTAAALAMAASTSAFAQSAAGPASDAQSSPSAVPGARDASGSPSADSGAAASDTNPVTSAGETSTSAPGKDAKSRSAMHGDHSTMPREGSTSSTTSPSAGSPSAGPDEAQDSITDPAAPPAN